MGKSNILKVIIIGGIILIVSATYFISTRNFLTRSESYTGVLSVSANCMIPEGCGPKYKLFDSGLQSYMPLLGTIKDDNSGLVVKVVGKKVPLPQSEYRGMNYNGLNEAIQVSSYSILSKVPYHNFLVDKAGQYTLQKYPCLSLKVYNQLGTNYDKSFSWEVSNDVTYLKVKMTGVKGSYELWYDGNSGNLVKEIVEPAGEKFCQ